jgi:hypothetical protein
MGSTHCAVLMSLAKSESWENARCLPDRRVRKTTRLLRLGNFEFMRNSDLQSVAIVHEGLPSLEENEFWPIT